MKSLKYLNKYFLKYKWRLVLGFLFIVISNVFNAFAPKFVQEIVDFTKLGLSGEGELSGIVNKTISWLSIEASEFSAFPLSTSFILKIVVWLSVAYVFLAIMKGFFLFLTRQTIIIMSRLIEYDLKNEIYDQYQKLSPSFYKQSNTGDLMNRISEDVSRVRMYLGPAIMYTINLAVLIVLVVVMMLSVNTKLTLFSLVPLPFMSIAIYLVSSKINFKSEKVQSQQSKLSTIVQESISGIRTIKSYHREASQTKYFKKESDLYKIRALDLVKTEAMFIPIIVLLVGLSSILTIYVGGNMVMAGELTIGEVFQFVFYVNMLTWPFASVGWITSLVQKAAASQKRINEFLEQKPAIVNYQDTHSKINGNIEFADVDFSYDDDPESLILKGINFKIKQGETLAIIGHTGSGKSTLANLFGRLFDIKSGEILIDGKPIKEINLHDLRTAIGYVSQDVFLFSENIRDNIAFGVTDASTAEIEQAAKDAVVHHNIVGFKEGYNTLLGERGINLSGGQKQRVSISRAILKNPPILIFDDCLSAVDIETEEKILTNLKKRNNNTTTVIISHRISSIKHADNIIVLEEGKIIESGSHKELLDAKGEYFLLYEKQLLEVG